MTREDLRRRTCLVIRRGSEYLVAVTFLTAGPKWSESVYDAWRTRNREHARRVAEKLGGEIYLFNPIIGQLREARL